MRLAKLAGGKRLEPRARYVALQHLDGGMVKLELVAGAAAIVSAEHQQSLQRVIARLARTIVGQHAP